MAEQIPDLSGKTALVTGASRGIGRAIALGLGKAGAHVLALARTVGALEELDDEIRRAGGKATLIPLDLADGSAILELGKALGARFSRLDILVAAAGMLGELAPLADVSEKVLRRTIDVNLIANALLIRALDPLLRASGAARAVFITSRVGGTLARHYWGPYAVSKAGLEMLARTYALEAAPSGVRVAIVDPGAMRTRMRAEAMPGENPATLPEPEAILPLLYRAVSADYQGEAERIVLREWTSR
jgi:NAD(P)-dependent dehydrogenase (short-subunit alcohol dehydrogenase family)